MAAPTPVTNTIKQGHYACLVWNATWATTDNLAAAAVIDLSAQDYTGAITVERIIAMTTTGIEFKLYFDDDSADELIYDSVLANTNQIDVDYTWGGRPGVAYQGSGGTGDVIITTTSAAAADEVSLVIFYKAH